VSYRRELIDVATTAAFNSARRAGLDHEIVKAIQKDVRAAMQRMLDERSFASQTGAELARLRRERNELLAAYAEAAGITVTEASRLYTEEVAA